MDRQLQNREAILLLNFDDPSPGAGAGIYTFAFLRKLGEEAVEKASFNV